MSSDSQSKPEIVVPVSPTLAEGVIRVVRTYLELPGFGHLRRGATAAVVARLVRVAPDAIGEWRSLYASIGGPYQWHDRDDWTDVKLAQHLASPGVRVFRVQALLPGAPLDDGGFLELETHHDGSVEIVYLGLNQRTHGHGLGRWLVAEAVEQARVMGATRVWLHTCTLDGPAALPNYLARGFVVVRTEEYGVKSRS
ncbi:MAG TPA: GNAT family N-acetyltransferase [Gemmatimonas sp.]|nr:GNAT family N-acetyltransferase [Gemmatimonas sp.]